MPARGCCVRPTGRARPEPPRQKQLSYRHRPGISKGSPSPNGTVSCLASRPFSSTPDTAAARARPRRASVAFLSPRRRLSGTCRAQRVRRGGVHGAWLSRRGRLAVASRARRPGFRPWARRKPGESVNYVKLAGSVSPGSAPSVTSTQSNLRSS